MVFFQKENADIDMNFPNNLQFSNFMQPHLKPPDPSNEDVSMLDYQPDIKGEYIEDCDPIKEETRDITDPKQIQPLQLPNYNQSRIQQTYLYIFDTFSVSIKFVQENTLK